MGAVTSLDVEIIRRLKTCLAEVGYPGARIVLMKGDPTEPTWSPMPGADRADAAWLRALELVGLRHSCWHCWRDGTPEDGDRCYDGDCPVPGGPVEIPLELLRFPSMTLDSLVSVD